MKYAFATMVKKQELSKSTLGTDILKVQTTLTAGVVEATSEYEAEGKVYAIARKCYPASEGYTEHFVVTGDGEKTIDPETVQLTPRK